MEYVLAYTKMEGVATYVPRISAAIKKHFVGFRLPILSLPTDDGRLYSIEEAFGDTANYWKGNVRYEPFGTKTEPTILYRPDITDGLFEKMEETIKNHPRVGVMVKGPRGIGKSHTLINLVHKLQSTGQYLVTFVPDCRLWDTDDFLLKTICDSFGVEFGGPHGISLGPQLSKDERQSLLHAIIRAIAGEVTKEGKQWVFVFDQINELFPKDTGPSCISSLRYPYYMIERPLDGCTIQSFQL
jgi:Cdc6-like AAA superfamily ATPase